MNRTCACVAALFLASVSFGQTKVAHHGKALSAVVVAADATPAEVHAAEDLAGALTKITGASIPLMHSPAVLPKYAFVVGQGSSARKLLPDVNWQKLGAEQTVLRSVGTRLVVAGGRPRGTLYAVSRLLSSLGVRYWTPWATDFPTLPNLTVAKMARSESPTFEYRDPFWFHSFDADWSTHNLCNGSYARLDAAHGGKLEREGVHSYYRFVPPAELFSKHPEWFSLIGGKRTYQDAQLCTTNPELRDYMVQKVREELRAHPELRMISVSQNDCYRPCECDKCRAQAKQEGSDAALTLDLVNYVAAKLEPEFPKVTFDTLAYQWSRKPPTSMQPRKNVAIWLCSIECSFSSPLDAPVNRSFADDVRGWSRLTSRLYIWDYCTNFAAYLAPQPDYFTFGQTLKFLSSHGTSGLFEEGAYQSNGGEMAEMKAWVQAQLMWNAKLDDDALIQEFLNGYYGAAGKPIYSYLKLMNEAAKPMHLSFAYGVDSKLFSYDTMHNAELIWQFAEQQVADRPALLWRVKQAHLGVQYVWLNRWSEYQRLSKERNDRWLLGPSRKAAAQEWLKVATSPGPAGWQPITVVNEGGTTAEQFVASLGEDPPTP